MPIFSSNFHPTCLKKTDYILSHMVGSLSDLENKFDFPANWKTGQFGCLIPYPREKMNLVAPLKTFSLEVSL